MYKATWTSDSSFIGGGFVRHGLLAQGPQCHSAGPRRLMEHWMSKPHKRADPHAQKSAPSDAGDARKDAARLGRESRAWVPAEKLPGKKFDARRNLPSGPLGGSGRKTNISRSS